MPGTSNSEETVSQEGLYRAIVEQAPDGVIVASVDGNVILCNDSASVIFGYSVSEILGQSLNLIIPMEFRDAHWRGFNRALADGRTRSSGQAMTTRSVHKTGRTIYVDLSFAVLKNSLGEMLGVLAVVRDASQRYARQKAMRAELDELRRRSAPER